MVLRSPGGEEREVSGEFREVVANRKLVFTWAWRSTPERQSLVTVEFVPTGDATALTLTHQQFADEAARDRHHHGWTGSLDRLAASSGAMNPRTQVTWNVFEGAKDAGDETVIAACRRAPWPRPAASSVRGRPTRWT